MKNKLFSPELTRVVIVICAIQLVAKVILAYAVTGMCYANEKALNREIQRTVDSELKQ